MPGQSLLLDTNILSCFLRGGKLAQRHERRTRGRMCFITFVTMGELLRGAERAGWGEARRASLEHLLARYPRI